MKKNLLLVLFGISLIVFASVRIASNNTIYYYTTSEAIENISVDQVKLLCKKLLAQKLKVELDFSV